MNILKTTTHFNVSVGILKIITEMFLPHISLSELENECFSKILPKVNMASTYLPYLIIPVIVYLIMLIVYWLIICVLTWITVCHKF